MLASHAPVRLKANGRAFAHIARFHPELTTLRRDRSEEHTSELQSH